MIYSDLKNLYAIVAEVANSDNGIVFDNPEAVISVKENYLLVLSRTTSIPTAEQANITADLKGKLDQLSAEASGQYFLTNLVQQFVHVYHP